MPPIDDDELFDDELEDEDEDDAEYEYEDFDDDEDGGGDEGFEEFEDDFAAGGPSEVKVKTVPGMDAFALGWTFFATLAAICVGTWFILYEIYDWRAFDILPEKERPEYARDIGVIGLGRDDAISDTVNYVVLDRGTNHDLIPGTMLEITSDRYDATIEAIVSDEALGNVSKAWITGIEVGDEVQLVATDFESSQDAAEAIRNIWLMGGEPGAEELDFSASAVSWTAQEITRR